MTIILCEIASRYFPVGSRWRRIGACHGLVRFRMGKDAYSMEEGERHRGNWDRIWGREITVDLER
jgi:hypothetical protein